VITARRQWAGCTPSLVVREEGRQRRGVVVNDHPRVNKRVAGLVCDDATGDDNVRRLCVAVRHDNGEQGSYNGETPIQCDVLDADADFLAVVFRAVVFAWACAYETNGTSAGTMSS